MNSPLIIQIRIPGEWKDAWLYKGFVLLWDEDGRMVLLKQEDIVSHIEKALDARAAVLAQYLVFRNDWKTSEAFRELMRVPGVAGALHRTGSSPHAVLTIDLDDIVNRRSVLSPVEPVPGLVLDTQIYANRTYVASTEGLFETYFQPRRPEYDYPLDRKLDFLTSRISARYLALNVSAEEQGLWFEPIHVDSQEDFAGFNYAPMRRVEEFSAGSSFAARNLLNYGRGGMPTLLRSRAERVRSHSRAQWDEWKVVGYDAAQSIDRLALGVLSTGRKMTSREATEARSTGAVTEGVRALGNSNYRLLVEWDGRLEVIDLRAFEGRDLEARPDRRFDAEDLAGLKAADVLSTHGIGSGFLVELFDRLLLFTADGVAPILEEPVAQIRTFPSSYRHKEAIAAITEGSLSLIGYLDGARTQAGKRSTETPF